MKSSKISNTVFTLSEYQATDYADIVSAVSEVSHEPGSIHIKHISMQIGDRYKKIVVMEKRHRDQFIHIVDPGLNFLL